MSFEKERSSDLTTFPVKKDIQMDNSTFFRTRPECWRSLRVVIALSCLSLFVIYNTQTSNEFENIPPEVTEFQATTNMQDLMQLYQHGTPMLNGMNITSEMNETKYILYWNKAYGNQHYLGEGSRPFPRCPVKNCYFTSNRSHIPLNSFHAVLFSLHEMEIHDLPDVRDPSQRYIMYTRESAARTRYDSTDMIYLDKFFNWTYTYRSDSDIVVPYGWVEPSTVDDISVRSSERNYAAGKTKLVAWFVSNCNPENERTEYAKQLQRYVEVDIYGKCGTKDCGRGNSSACYTMLESQYKFYLSFENSNCADYVTEKFFKILNKDIVPIVYGGQHYDAIAPLHSYIDIRNYKSAKELADYLKLLDKKDNLYNEYFWWKRFYKVRTEYDAIKASVCGLCARLVYDTTPKVYNSILEWWRVRGNCTHPRNSDFPVWKQ